MVGLVARHSAFAALAGASARVLAVTAVFVIAAPPVAAAAFIILVEGFRMLAGLGFDWSITSDTFLASFVPEVYIYGSGPAAAAGVVVGLRVALSGQAGAWFALATGFLIGACVVAIILAIREPSESRELPLLAFTYAHVVACMVSTLAASRLAQYLLRRVAP